MCTIAAPSWSPDGSSIAWFSDQGGEYQLYIGSQDGKGEPRAIKVVRRGILQRSGVVPGLAEDRVLRQLAERLLGGCRRQACTKKIASQPLYGPNVTIGYDWSPDSKWLAYAMDNKANITTVYAHSAEQGKSFQVTDGLSDVSDPVFDKSGKYLYFLGSTDAGPVKDWFALSNADMRATSAIYLAVLQNDVLSPLARESDEEKPAAAANGPAPAEEKKADAAPAPVPEEKPSAKKDAPFRIDFEGLEFRILDLPIPRGELSNLQVGSAGQIYYLKTVDQVTSLNRYDLTTRKNETLLPATGYGVSADGKKLLYVNSNNWSIVPTTRSVNPSEGRIPVDSIEVRIDPRAEWKQIFDEAWRINRDYFYAPNMHGADWKTHARRSTRAFLPHVATRQRPEPRPAVDVERTGRRPHRVDGGDAAHRAAGTFRADCSAPTTRWRTAATASRRSTAA